MGHPHGAPTFSLPEKQPLHPFEPPTARQVWALRGFTALWVASGGAALVAVALGAPADSLLIPAVPIVFIVRWAMRGSNDHAGARLSFAVRYAWLGPDAKLSPPLARLVQQRADAEARERAEAQAFDQAEREAQRVRTWVTAGLVASEAPGPEFVASARAAVPSAVELTLPEVDAIRQLVGGDVNFGWSELNTGAPTDGDSNPRRPAAVDGLVARGILRHVGGRVELAPAWLPLLGVAFYAEQGLQYSWERDGQVFAFTVLQVPGHMVVQELALPFCGQTEEQLEAAIARDADAVRHGFAKSTPAEILDRIESILPDLLVPLISGEHNYLAVSEQHDWETGGAGRLWFVVADGQAWRLREGDREWRHLTTSQLRDELRVRVLKCSVNSW